MKAPSHEGFDRMPKVMFHVRVPHTNHRPTQRSGPQTPFHIYKVNEQLVSHRTNGIPSLTMYQASRCNQMIHCNTFSGCNLSNRTLQSPDSETLYTHKWRVLLTSWILIPRTCRRGKWMPIETQQQLLNHVACRHAIVIHEQHMCGTS